MTPAVTLNASDSCSESYSLLQHLTGRWCRSEMEHDTDNKLYTSQWLYWVFGDYLSLASARTCPGLLTAWGGNSQLICPPNRSWKTGDDEAHEVSSTPLNVTLFCYWCTFFLLVWNVSIFISGSSHYQATVLSFVHCSLFMQGADVA